MRRPFYSDHGDPFTLLNIFTRWLEVKEGERSAKKWCAIHGIEEQRLFEIVKLKNQFENILEKYSGATIRPETKVKSKEEQREHWDKQRLVDKRKMESRGNTRKFLKLEEELTEDIGEDDNENGLETIDEIEFQLYNDPKSILQHSDVSSLSYRDLIVLKLIICAGLYPNIAICDDANYARPLTEQVFHTKNKRFLNMIPNSVFYLHPELLHGTPSDAQQRESGNQLENLHQSRIQKEVLCYVEILETNKPYIMNCVRIGALPVVLLFANKIDISSDLMDIIVDDWLHIEFTSFDAAESALLMGLWTRYAWKYLVNRKLKNLDSDDASAPEQNMKITKQYNLDDISYIPTAVKKMRQSFLELCYNHQVLSSLTDEEVVDKIMDFVDLDGKGDVFLFMFFASGI